MTKNGHGMMTFGSAECGLNEFFVGVIDKGLFQAWLSHREIYVSAFPSSKAEVNGISPSAICCTAFPNWKIFFWKWMKHTDRDICCRRMIAFLTTEEGLTKKRTISEVPWQLCGHDRYDRASGGKTCGRASERYHSDRPI